MDKKNIIFGLSGKFGSTGLISSYPSSVFRTAGLNGIIQPYQVYIRETNQDGPYVERTKLTTDDQDTTQYSNRMTTTEYIKGHGDVSEAASKLQPGETQTASTSKAPEENEAKSAPPQTITSCLVSGPSNFGSFGHEHNATLPSLVPSLHAAPNGKKICPGTVFAFFRPVKLIKPN